MYSGYFVSLGSEKRFVIPAILSAVIADMVEQMRAEDPQDEFEIKVIWGQSSERPEYAVGKESK